MSSVNVNSQVQAYRYLREQILAGQLMPGDRVSDFVFAPRIGVSRTPVREAIRQLQAEGLVDNLGSGGARVKMVTGLQLVELVQLREALEVYAVRLAVPRLGAEDLAELESQCEAMYEAAVEARRQGGSQKREPIGQQPVNSDLCFHMVFLRRCGNPRIVKLLSDCYLLVHISMQYHRDRSQFSPSQLGLLSWIWRDHLRICKAAQRGDADMAAHRMSEHIRFYPQRIIPGYTRWLAGEEDRPEPQTPASAAERWLLGGDYEASQGD